VLKNFKFLIILNQLIKEIDYWIEIIFLTGVIHIFCSKKKVLVEALLNLVTFVRTGPDDEL